MSIPLPSPTPLLDRATLTRLTTEDFPLTDQERDLLRNPAERYLLEDAFREVVDLDTVAAAAVELWRERRTCIRLRFNLPDSKFGPVEIVLALDDAEGLWCQLDTAVAKSWALRETTP